MTAGWSVTLLRQSANHAIVNTSNLRETVQQFLLQAFGKFAMQHLRSELFRGVARMFGGWEPPAISTDHQAKNVLDGATEFGGMVE